METLIALNLLHCQWHCCRMEKSLRLLWLMIVGGLVCVGKCKKESQDGLLSHPRSCLETPVSFETEGEITLMHTRIV